MKALTHRGAVIGLVIVAAVWGASFTVIKAALADLSPLMLLALRFLSAALLALPFARGFGRREVVPGLVVGLLFWAGFVFQTSGLAWTTPSRSAFITGLSVPLVPIVFMLVHGHRPRAATMGGVLLALAGMYFLTRPEPGTALNRGDLLTLGCAVSFAGQIVAAGHFARRVPARHLLVMQLGLTGLLSLGASPLLETPQVHLGATALWLLLFLCVSAVLTFGFQLRAQQIVSPSQTALIFALEPVFAALTSYVVLGEVLAPLQWVGGALIVAAMLLPELVPLPGPAGDRA